MRQKDKDYLGAERRNYSRLDTVFPVEFRLVSTDATTILSGWFQGFTNNIGKGGLCLSVNNFPPEFIQAIRSRQTKLYLNIEVPVSSSPTAALARPAWVKEVTEQTGRYLIGLSYQQIDSRQNRRIMRYVRFKKTIVPLALSLIIIFGLGLIINSFVSLKLIKGNKVLVEQLIKILQESSVTKQKVKEINRQKEDLQLRIEALTMRIMAQEEEKKQLLEKKKMAGGQILVKTEELTDEISRLIQEKISLQEELIALQEKESGITEELLLLDKKKNTLEKANLYRMYQWLKTRQNADAAAKNPVSTYEQALAMQVYNYFGAFAHTRKLLNFFYRKAERKDNLFFDAYHYDSGNPMEQTVYDNSNIWLGIAIVQYTQKTRDEQFLGLAEEIAQAVADSLNKAPYNNEDVINAYAFFNLLHKITEKQPYLQARDKTLKSWVKRSSPSAWAIVAISPQKLEELGINPDRIIESAQEDYKGGIEQAAKMILALKIMADFYYQKNMIAKAHTYELKSDKYLTELTNVNIYTPASGIAHTVFAYYKYSPLTLEE